MTVNKITLKIIANRNKCKITGKSIDSKPFCFLITTNNYMLRFFILVFRTSKKCQIIGGKTLILSSSCDLKQG